MPKKATNKRPARQRNHAITWRCGNCPKSVKSFHTGSKSRHHLRTHQDSHLPEFWTRIVDGKEDLRTPKIISRVGAPISLISVPSRKRSSVRPATSSSRTSIKSMIDYMSTTSNFLGFPIPFSLSANKDTSKHRSRQMNDGEKEVTTVDTSDSNDLEPLVVTSTNGLSNDEVMDGEPTETNPIENEHEQPAAITTAITTIISHFVISSEGLTKSRIEILQTLLNELSHCDEEAKTAVNGLNQILAELQPQETTENNIPTLVYDPSNDKVDNSSDEVDHINDEVDHSNEKLDHFNDKEDQSNEKLYHSNDKLDHSNEKLDHSNAKILETYNVVYADPPIEEPMEVECVIQSSVNPLKSPAHSNVLPLIPVQITKVVQPVNTMEDILKSQRTQQSDTGSKPSIYDLCLWCNKLVISSKTKDHAMIKHRAIGFHDSFRCPFCYKIFNSNNTVIEHMRYIPLCSKADTDTPITCSLCKDTFVGAGTIREHYIIFHNIGCIANEADQNRRAFWSCIYCGIAEHSKTGLSKHIKTYHHNVSPHFCRFCGIKYHSLNALHKHLIIRHRIGLGDTLYDYYTLVCDLNFKLESNSANKVCCTYCDEELDDEQHADNHVLYVHYCKEQNLFLCAFCNATYKSKEALEKHVFNGHMLGGLGFMSMSLPKPKLPVEAAATATIIIEPTTTLAAPKTTSETGVEIVETVPQNVTFYLCPICGDTTHNIDHFREHSSSELIEVASQQIMENKSDWMTSEKCILVRDMISTMIMPVNGSSSTEVVCSLCRRLLGSRSVFNLHFQEMHLKKYDIQCKDCQLVFKHQSALNIHNSKFHDDRTIRYKRHMKDPSSSHYVIRSIKQHKGPNDSSVFIDIPDKDQIVDISSTPEPEEVVQQKLKSKKLHQNIILTQPKMSCTLCDYKCYRIDHLEEHIQAKHYKTSVNQCTMCNSRYSRRRDLRRHYINKHNLAPLVAREMTELTTPTEPWRTKKDLKGKKLSQGSTNNIESLNIPAVFVDTGEIMNVTESKDENSTDNLCDINPDILDISLVGNLDKD